MSTAWSDIPTEPTPPIERAVYTVAEVAQLMGVGTWTIRRWIRTGILPRTNTPSMLVPKVAFDRWLNGPEQRPKQRPR